jgi:hypothetical protein
MLIVNNLEINIIKSYVTTFKAGELEFGSQQFQERNLLRVIQTCSAAKPASYPKGTGRGFNLGVKRRGREPDHFVSD